MQFPLKINFKNKTIYKDFWNYFAKSLLIKENKNLSPLIITEKEEKIELYKKLFSFLEESLIEIKTEADFFDCLWKKEACFILSKEKLHTINFYNLQQRSIHIKKWSSYSLESIIEKLTSIGYHFKEHKEAGSYKKQGDILTITNPSATFSYQISFWGESVEEIQSFKLREENKELREYAKKEEEEIVIGANQEIFEEWKENIVDILNQKEVFFILDELQFYKNYETLLTSLDNFIAFDAIGWNNGKEISLSFWDINAKDIENLKSIMQGKKNILLTKNKKLMDNFVHFNNLEKTQIIETNASFLKSFSTGETNYICDDILLKIFVKKRIKKTFAKDLDLLLKINKGDFVVHIDHGIGVFQGLVVKELGKIKKEYIEILYKDNDKLFVPTTEIERVSKYVGWENPTLTSLSTKEWKKNIEKAQKDVEKIAEELLEVYAARKMKEGLYFHIDEEKQNIFQRDFPYIYTEGQTHAIEEILSDMGSEKNMDRLLVGDVGFWKTEVAFNALYAAFYNKKQAILISPLVVLAYEHFEKAKERMEKFWVNIAVLTRLETEKQVKDTMKKIENGEIDIIIGTHKLLSEKIVYKNLGLIVIDEEHRFGVEDKEKIKKLKHSLDSLSLSATPIPRSLNMALSWLRDISILKEAPLGRKDIQTSVAKFDEGLIKIAWEREFARGWQIFFVHNRVESLEIIKQKLEHIFPKKKIIITHGRLPWDTLEERILAFKRKKYDILLSTTVIENGIDFSNVNTIFINECQSFWLSQIHQLRGRVGRSDKEGFCYLLYRKEFLTEETVKRLKAIVKYSFLGSGFEIAMKDLEIRWWGDILGIRQSGQATKIGINLFIDMLEDKIEELKKWPIQREKESENFSLDLSISAFIPDSYFNGEIDKINFYREIESIYDSDDLKALREDFEMINPDFPPETKNLFDILKLKIKAKKYKIEKIRSLWGNYEIQFSSKISLDDLKNFLKLDKEVLFHIVNIDKIRASKKNFKDDESFVSYLLKLFSQKLTENKKIRLKK